MLGIQQAFQHRSARVIALGRVVLAVFFTLAIWLDPARSARIDDLTFLLMLAYTFFAYTILVAIWTRWWLEARLAVVAHVVDLVVFTILVMLTEGYISPFFTFFVFLVLAASIRWGWREALLTAVAVTALFLVAVYMTPVVVPQGIAVPRAIVRGGNLLVLSLMIAWFGINRPREHEDSADHHMLDRPPAAPGPPVRQAMRYAARQLGAERIVFAWTEAEEPWLHVWGLAGDALDVVRLPPDTFPRLVSDELADQPFLFDLRRHKILVLRRGRRVRLTDTEPIDHAFAARYHIEAGLAFPIAIEDYRGQLFALGVPGLCSDDLKAASGVAQAISSAFERTALFFATEEAAATRARLRLARDLHDSVAQFFAGMALKLHALTKNSVLEPAVRRELEELQQELAREQRDFRGLLSALRDPEAAGGGAELAEPIRLLVARLERQWSMQCDISFDPPSMRAPASLQHELEQLIREAVANAVRHGEAKRITIAIAEKEGLLELRIADDGNGFPVEGAFADADLRARGVGPRSLHERVQALRGTLALVSDHDTGSVLTLFLPLGGSA